MTFSLVFYELFSGGQLILASSVDSLPPPQAPLAFNFIDFDSLRSACQISKSRQKIRG